ncbi:hypothetical protein [Futiania mangrovi]|uniref:Tetratricopeptide repeat protein n=1 Tax=Futiania mangrovi TaxID=2959716 RepID=A0A9J6PHI2_9PROT|nr:hypothetical protein [Futiania mangrovii]MCP1335546.1 hypothetical protein [Futiania mangrovii]
MKTLTFALFLSGLMFAAVQPAEGRQPGDCAAAGEASTCLLASAEALLPEIEPVQRAGIAIEIARVREQGGGQSLLRLAEEALAVADRNPDNWRSSQLIATAASIVSEMGNHDRAATIIAERYRGDLGPLGSILQKIAGRSPQDARRLAETITLKPLPGLSRTKFSEAGYAYEETRFVIGAEMVRAGDTAGEEMMDGAIAALKAMNPRYVGQFLPWLVRDMAAAGQAERAEALIADLAISTHDAAKARIALARFFVEKAQEAYVDRRGEDVEAFTGQARELVAPVSGKLDKAVADLKILAALAEAIPEEEARAGLEQAMPAIFDASDGDAKLEGLLAFAEAAAALPDLATVQKAAQDVEAVSARLQSKGRKISVYEPQRRAMRMVAVAAARDGNADVMRTALSRLDGLWLDYAHGMVAFEFWLKGDRVAALEHVGRIEAPDVRTQQLISLARQAEGKAGAAQ